MRVLLRADVSGVGKKGDIVEVADGFGRNYLVPRGLALKATPGVEAQAESMRRSRDQKDAQDRSAAEDIAKVLVPLTITVPAKAGAEAGRLAWDVIERELVNRQGIPVQITRPVMANVESRSKSSLPTGFIGLY